jgi:hypothetical protein
MKKLRKYQIDGEFSNMKELKGVTEPFRDSHWYDKTRTPSYIDEYDDYLAKYSRRNQYGSYNLYDFYNQPINSFDPNFLNQVINLTNKVYSPELYSEQGHDIYDKYYGNKIEFKETDNNDDNLIHNIFQNHNYNAQYKNVNGQTDWEKGNCYIDSNGYRICGYNPYQLGNKNTDFETINKYKNDAARRTYQIATRDFTPYDFEGMLNQPKSYRMADESENTPIGYGPENLFVLPNKSIEEKPRTTSIEGLYRKEINELPSQNIAVPDINRNVQPLPEVKPVREPRTMKLTPQEEAEFFKKNNIQPIPKNKTRKLTPAEEIEFKKKYNIK